MKIDIFIDGKYYCSTNQSKTCKEALKKIIDCSEKYLMSYGMIRQAIIEGKKITARRCK